MNAEGNWSRLYVYVDYNCMYVELDASWMALPTSDDDDYGGGSEQQAA